MEAKLYCTSLTNVCKRDRETCPGTQQLNLKCHVTERTDGRDMRIESLYIVSSIQFDTISFSAVLREHIKYNGHADGSAVSHQ